MSGAGGTRRELRVRSLILALAAFAGLALSILAGAVIAGRQAPEAASALMAAGLISLFGAAAITALIWVAMDTHICRPIGRLATALRSRATAAHPSPVDPRPLRHLGDLGPAAAQICDELIEERRCVRAEVARATERLESQRKELVDILSEIPVGILVADTEDRIVLYDRQSVHALQDSATLVLGRSIHAYFNRAALSRAMAEVDREDAPLFVDADLPLADGSRTLRVRVRRLGSGRGHALAIEIAPETVSERPLVFDFTPIFGTGDSAIEDTPLSRLTFTIFDTETTGLDTATDALVQIGAVRTRISGEEETFETLVRPDRPIPPVATRIHGLSNADVADAPDTATALRRFHEFASDSVLVAHNAPFDLSFLRRGPESFDHPVLDTVLLSAEVFGRTESHTLDSIAARLGVEVPSGARHTALGDARITAQVFRGLLDILGARGVGTFGEALAAMRRHESLLRDANRDR